MVGLPSHKFAGHVHGAAARSPAHGFLLVSFIAAQAAGAGGYVLKVNLVELRGLWQSAAAKESGQQSSMNEE